MRVKGERPAVVLSEFGQESRKVTVEREEAGIEDSFRKDGERGKQAREGSERAETGDSRPEAGNPQRRPETTGVTSASVSPPSLGYQEAHSPILRPAPKAA